MLNKRAEKLTDILLQYPRYHRYSFSLSVMEAAENRLSKIKRNYERIQESETVLKKYMEFPPSYNPLNRCELRTF